MNIQRNYNAKVMTWSAVGYQLWYSLVNKKKNGCYSLRRIKRKIFVQEYVKYDLCSRKASYMRSSYVGKM